MPLKSSGERDLTGRTDHPVARHAGLEAHDTQAYNQRGPLLIRHQESQRRIPRRNLLRKTPNRVHIDATNVPRRHLIIRIKHLLPIMPQTEYGNWPQPWVPPRTPQATCSGRSSKRWRL
eukprot:3201838-Pyramimonas_sp.AAC.1